MLSFISFIHSTILDILLKRRILVASLFVCQLVVIVQIDVCVAKCVDDVALCFLILGSIYKPYMRILEHLKG